MCILPIFLYGSDCWAISKTDAHKIDALDQWCLRMLLGIKWYKFVRNDDVRSSRFGSEPPSVEDDVNVYAETRSRPLYKLTFWFTYWLLCQYTCEITNTFDFNKGEVWSASTTSISVILSNNKNSHNTADTMWNCILIKFTIHFAHNDENPAGGYI